MQNILYKNTGASVKLPLYEWCLEAYHVTWHEVEAGARLEVFGVPLSKSESAGSVEVKSLGRTANSWWDGGLVQVSELSGQKLRESGFDVRSGRQTRRTASDW